MSNSIPEQKGKLFIVPTPIGNLEDVTIRSLRILKEVNLIAAEDTRVSKIFLNHYEIKTQLISFHSFNEQSRKHQLIEKLKNGELIAIISDAGTPGISDPSFSIIDLAIKNNIPIEVLPGPTALIPALVISGLPTHHFKFVGFLPHKKGRKNLIDKLRIEESTLIFYESPHRIKKTLNELLISWGFRKAVLVREISKMFEEVIRGDLNFLNSISNSRVFKGEIVLIVEGNQEIS
ncbi:MAG: 16S rRNA (cytidine(1402)-2'-O)-methyltransferase [Bacteroidetes bacterium]|nr:16S rRNA (cytidine(1402)-2'-O)-methyltransferase [Bacteroidota bacterium]